MCLEIIMKKLQQHLPGINELIPSFAHVSVHIGHTRIIGNSINVQAEVKQITNSIDVMMEALQEKQAMYVSATSKPLWCCIE